MKDVKRLKLIRNFFIFICIISMFSITAFAYSGIGFICGENVNMRSGPSLDSEVLVVLPYGASINIHGIHEDWYEIDYNNLTGYVYSSYVVAGEQNIVYTLTIPNQEPVVIEENPTPIVETNYNTSGQAIADAAMRYLGLPYIWGGESLAEGGFDCSGLVYAAYLDNGITINRVAQDMTANGKEVDINNLQVGDILLFGSSIYNIWHVGIYIGNGEYIHAPYGEVVKTQTLASTYGMLLIGARRVIN